MKVENINPFIESVSDLFETMLSTSVQREDIKTTDHPSKADEVTAVIGMTGPVEGAVALSFPFPTAVALVGQFLGMPLNAVDETVSDGISEFVNIIGGSTKAKFPIPVGSDPISLTLPKVIQGQCFEVPFPTGLVWIEVPFTSDLGRFTLRVSIQSEL